MKIELPKFRRCCFCIPLRYGLLIWGYIKLTISLFIFLFGALIMQIYMPLFLLYGSSMLDCILIGMFLLMFLLIDMGMTIAFLVGGHQKTTRLFRVFYVYNIVLLCVFMVIFVTYNVLTSKLDGRAANNHVFKFELYEAYITTETALGILNICVQAYVIILLRSEIDKLSKNSRNFRFTNYISDAACTMENADGNEAGIGTDRTNETEIEIHNQTVEKVKEINKKAFSYEKI